MNYPSIKRIAQLEILQHEGGDTKAKAKTIRMLMDGSLDPVTGEISDEVVYSEFTRLQAIDKELNTHGVEYLYADGVNIIYCNTGDPNTTTIIYDCDKERWLLTSWGDIVERAERKRS